MTDHLLEFAILNALPGPFIYVADGVHRYYMRYGECPPTNSVVLDGLKAIAIEGTIEFNPQWLQWQRKRHIA